VGGDQRPQRQGVVLDLGDGLAVSLRLVVDFQIDPFNHDLRPFQYLHPQRKDLHNGGFSGRDADEVEGGDGFGHNRVSGDGSGFYHCCSFSLSPSRLRQRPPPGAGRRPGG